MLVIIHEIEVKIDSKSQLGRLPNSLPIQMNSVAR